MPINTNIATGYRGVEVPQQNVLADYAAIQQIQGGRQTQELNALKMQEYERARTEEEGARNFLRGRDLASPDTRTGLTQFGKTGLALAKSLSEQDTAALTQREALFKLEKGKKDFLGQAQRDTSQNPSDANITAFKEDLLASPLFTEPEKVRLAANADRILAMPVGERRAFMSSQGASPSELKPVLTPQNLGGTARILSTPAFGGAATQVVGSEGTVTAAPAALPAPTTLARLQAELALLPKGDPRIPAYQAMIKKETEFAPRPITNVNLPPQQNAFEGELGKGQAKSIIENRAVAQDAASIIETVNTGRDILKGKIITGAGADFFVNFNQALKTAGVDFGYADAAANSQAYAANMAQNVGKIIKQFGAGTGLSDADRQYAEKMAGGKITLDAKALNKILDINERAARNVIKRHNKDVAGIKTNIPLTVDMPAKRAEPVAGVTAPPVAIEYLRANPSMKSAFDAKYGAGAADRALKGQ